MLNAKINYINIVKILPLLFLITILVTFKGFLSTAEILPRAPHTLLCEEAHDPIGIGTSKPSLRWIPSSSDYTHYQVLVASTKQLLTPRDADLWDSGKVAYVNDFLIPVTYAGKQLKSGQGAFWSVRVWHSSGQVSEFAPAAFFEVGLLSKKDFGKAKWISFPSQPNQHNHRPPKHSYFLGTFQIRDTPIRKVRIYSTGVDFYRIFVNDHEILQGPAPSSAHRLLVQTTALDPQILSSETRPYHTILVRHHYIGRGQSRVEKQPGVILKLVIDYTDGEKQEVITDKQWNVSEAEWITTNQPTVRNSEGVPAEAIDARKRLDTKDPTKLVQVSTIDIQNNPTLVISAQQTKIIERVINPVSVRRLKDGSYVADLGRVVAGSPRITFYHQTAGTHLTIAGGYRLNASDQVIASEQRTNLTYEYTTSGIPSEVFRPFWYLGMRYLQISPTTTRPKIEFVSRHNFIDAHASHFESSNGQLNQLWKLAKHSATYSGQEHFIDTPTREQGQFLYDSYLIGIAQALIFGERLLNRQALRQFAIAQNSQGQIDAVAPNGGDFQNIIDWSLIYPTWLYHYYFISLDKSLLVELAPTAFKVGSWVLQHKDHRTGLYDFGNKTDASSGYVDWPNRFNYDLSTSQRAVINAEILNMLIALKRIAQTIGDREKLSFYRDESRALKRALTSKLLNRSLNLYTDGLLPNLRKSNSHSNQTQAVFLASEIPGKRLASALGAFLGKQTKFDISLILSRYLIKALGITGQSKALLQYLTVPNGQNFATILQAGGTFTFESWEGHSSTLGESESHGYGAYTLISAIIEYIAGIRCIAPGCKRVIFSPLDIALDSVKCGISTPYGKASIALSKENPSYFHVPQLSTGILCLPISKTSVVYVDNEPAKKTRSPLDYCTSYGPFRGGLHKYEIKKAAS